jgi:hypothetical protein
MPHFQIHVEWASSKILHIEAETMDEAIERVGDFELDEDYIEDSWQIHRELCEQVSGPPTEKPDTFAGIFRKHIVEIRKLKDLLEYEDAFENVGDPCISHIGLAVSSLETAAYQMSIARTVMDTVEVWPNRDQD